MRAFVLVSCLLVSVSARPEAGYTYSGLEQNSGSQSLVQHQQLPAEHAYANFASQLPNTYTSSLPSDSALNSVEHTLAAGTAGSTDLSQQDSYNAAYQESSVSQSDDGGYSYAPQHTTIHKHVYVHVPPKDFGADDVIETRVRHAPAAKQKHYKIVFIKAPAPPSIRPPVVPPPPQNEEKTLIYVLHKKPEEVKDIIIPTPAPTKPSKPEVYFIKYKTKKEEAPVYGPPPQQQHQSGQLNIADLDPRHADAAAASAAYSGPIADEYTTDLTAPLTTIQPALEQQQEHYQQQQQQQQHFENDLANDNFDLGTSLPFATGEQLHSQSLSSASAQAPNNQYLAPETMSPIVVEEPSSNLPSSDYGPPGFFQKKK